MSTRSEILTPVSPAATVPETSAKHALRRSDQDLQVARRIDWRFLLPEPYLHRVAYCGPERGQLPAALKHFSASLKIVSTAETGTFDLVVLHLCEVSVLEKAHTLLEPGGILYWEMKPLDWAARWPQRTDGRDRVMPATLKRWSRTPNLFRGHIDTLTRLGFRDIEMYWLRPNFEACLEIIPMHDPVALDYAFTCPRSDWASRLKFAAGRMMMQTGMLARLTPCFSLIARK